MKVVVGIISIILLFSCNQNNKNVITSSTSSDTIIHNETTCVILNDSFKYNVVLASELGEDGLIPQAAARIPSCGFILL